MFSTTPAVSAGTEPLEWLEWLLAMALPGQNKTVQGLPSGRLPRPQCILFPHARQTIGPAATDTCARNAKPQEPVDNPVLVDNVRG